MGKLNILQHKSWHVYSEKNRQRVRRDEEDAARAEAEKRDRADKADQEARIQLLRSRARGASADSQQAEQASLGDDASGWQAQASTADSKISSTASIMAMVMEAPRAGNPEVEAEMRAERRKQDQQTTVYLGETRCGRKEHVWYAELDYGRARHDARLTEHERERRRKKDEKLKAREDPASQVSKYLAQKKSSSSSSSSSLSVPASGRDAGRPHRQSKSAASAASATPHALPSPSSSGTSSIEKLRQERLEREAREQARARQLLDPSSTHARQSTPGGAAIHERDDAYFYSQFNARFSYHYP